PSCTRGSSVCTLRRVAGLHAELQVRKEETTRCTRNTKDCARIPPRSFAFQTQTWSGCQMSNVECRMSNELVKRPTDPIGSVGNLVHSTLDIRHLTTEA